MPKHVRKRIVPRLATGSNIDLCCFDRFASSRMICFAPILETLTLNNIFTFDITAMRSLR